MGREVFLIANCASCHAKPPTGSVFPDVAGKHAKHEALAGVTNVCAACHTGADRGAFDGASCGADAARARARGKAAHRGSPSRA